MYFFSIKSKKKIKERGVIKEINQGRICRPFTLYKERKSGLENTAINEPAVINKTTQKSKIPNNNNATIKVIRKDVVTINLIKKELPKRNGINL